MIKFKALSNVFLTFVFHCICTLGITCLISQSDVAFAAEAPKTPPKAQSAQVMVDIYDTPISVQAMDKYYLVYELYLTNFYNKPISLDSLQVHDKTTGMPLVGFDKNSLKKIMRSCDGVSSSDDSLIASSDLKIVYLLVPFNSKGDIPKEIFHRLNFSKPSDGSHEELDTLSLRVDRESQAMLSPPVAGDYWVSANGLSNTSSHRLAHWVVSGQNYFAQRYGIDFIQINKDGRAFQGNEYDNASYFSYGKDVFSTARGTVIAIKNDIPENIPHSGKQFSSQTPDNIAGNYVVVELAKNMYAFYAHLKPGSIKVKVGEKINEGQKIAEIGNSGNSVEPHLHFHIVDRPAYLGGNGVPYTFTQFWVRPSEIAFNGSEKIYKMKESTEDLKRYTNQLMLDDTVIRFAEAGAMRGPGNNVYMDGSDSMNMNPRSSIQSSHGTPGASGSNRSSDGSNTPGSNIPGSTMRTQSNPQQNYQTQPNFQKKINHYQYNNDDD